jgi:hypothetical protein
MYACLGISYASPVVKYDIRPVLNSIAGYRAVEGIGSRAGVIRAAVFCRPSAVDRTNFSELYYMRLYVDIWLLVIVMAFRSYSHDLLAGIHVYFRRPCYNAIRLYAVGRMGAFAVSAAFVIAVPCN